MEELRAALLTTVRQTPRRHIVLATAAVVILIALVVLVPLPTALELRDWANAVGPWFPVAFFAAHVAVTVLPFPRTAFTLAAGLLFGTALGIALAVAASTVSALIAFLLVRSAGWRLTRLVSHPRMEEIEDRLARRGWPAVLALRLIAAVPFSVVNYLSGAAGVRLVPYTAATVVGLIPGTAAFVLLGDAFTGNVNPLLVVISICTAAVGLIGLVLEIRSHRRDQRRTEGVCELTPDATIVP